MKKENQDGPNDILELLYIRKSCPDIFINKLDPPYLAYNDYTWQSFIHSFIQSRIPQMDAEGGRRRLKRVLWRDSRAEGNVWPGSRAKPVLERYSEALWLRHARNLESH